MKDGQNTYRLSTRDAAVEQLVVIWLFVETMAASTRLIVNGTILRIWSYDSRLVSYIGKAIQRHVALVAKVSVIRKEAGRRANVCRLSLCVLIGTTHDGVIILSQSGRGCERLRSQILKLDQITGSAEELLASRAYREPRLLIQIWEERFDYQVFRYC